ncbi:MAG TPA: ComEA family DNA-binding protein [Acidimicrobiia bacterium]|nr:ComEA family DNA-binding protein [Acidimicrobiia bacterium]
MQPQHLVAGGVALLIAIASGVWFGGRPAQPVPVVVDRTSDSGTTPTVDRLTVHVSGAVVSPGLVELSEGARGADALAAAGGALPSADLSAMNLAAPVVDGTLMIVPRRNDDAPPAAQSGDGRIRVNYASADEIASLPGIGPVLARRIADYRDDNGPFVVVEDLLDVPGIGEGKLAAIRDSVSIP